MPLQQQEGVEGRRRGTEAHRDATGGAEESPLTGALDEGAPVGAALAGDLAEPSGHRIPGEAPAVDDDTAEGRAVPSEELRRRVHDDVGPQLERSQQVRRRERRVDDEGDAVAVGDRRDGGHIEHAAPRIRDGLRDEGPGARSDRRFPGVGIARVGHEVRRDAETAEVGAQELARALVDARRRDDVVARLEDRQQRRRGRGLAAAHQQRADAALEVGDAALRRGGGRVADAGVAVAGLGVGEARLAVAEVVELEARGQVDGRRAGAVRVEAAGAGVQLTRREGEGRVGGLGCGHGRNCTAQAARHGASSSRRVTRAGAPRHPCVVVCRDVCSRFRVFRRGRTPARALMTMGACPPW
ncbi:hypothetical protein GCM10017586_25940 [Microbacterium imperiale]|uniref:Uncharacterized protein n=1 Tax=Microbacterium imperiale TaxID=33884 RepID=A0A9W6M4C7_9MICO|nr:hypothetical protein GCM10017586_25940 [Microbacterium imperiale]